MFPRTQLHNRTPRRTRLLFALASLLLSPAMASTAHAFDAFGGDDDVIMQSARSARYANPLETPLAQATARANVSRAASNKSTVPTPLDLVGQGGKQDEVANQIYMPGDPGWSVR
jgi:hypothetical protein